MSSTPAILLAATDASTLAFLADNLTADGYAVRATEAAPNAITALASDPPDLVLLGGESPSLALLDAVRGGEHIEAGVDPDVAIMVLSAAGELHRIRLLEHGADDVVVTPFSYPELRARIEALLRRAAVPRNPRLLRAGPVQIDLTSRTVRVADRVVDLSPKEYALLVALAAAPARVFTRGELLRDVWGFRCAGRTRTLDSHAARLRAKLSAAGAAGLVHNIWGVGYVLMTPAAARRAAA